MKQIAPKGWTPGKIEKRYADIAPASFDADARTVECVISRGSPVQRIFGIEKLRIARDAVDISRLISTGIPFLDSHQQIGIDNALGKFQRIWFPGDGSLVGKIKFNNTPKGKLAAGMVSRGEISGVSCGYKVLEWEITDENGDVLDPEHDRIRWDDTGLTFTAASWELLEVSAVLLVAADSTAAMRGLTSHRNVEDVRARMIARQHMHSRADDLEYDDVDSGDIVKKIIDRMKVKQKTMEMEAVELDDFIFGDGNGEAQEVN
jgi:hypothetical protein